MKTTKLILVTCLFILTNLGYAQHSRDYIITLEGDTIRGNVEFAGFKRDASKRLKFIYSENEKTEWFNTSEILGFRELGSEYEVLELGNSISPKPYFNGKNRLFAQRLLSRKTKLYKVNYKQLKASFPALQGLMFDPFSGKPNNSYYAELEESYVIRFQNSDLAVFANSKIESEIFPLIFTDKPDFHKEQSQKSTKDLYLMVSGYDNYPFATDSVRYDPEYNQDDIVNIYIFRRNLPLDDNYPAHRVSLNGTLVGNLEKGEFILVKSTKAQWYNLRLKNGKLKSDYDLFARRDHAIFLEVAMGDKIYVTPIDGESAKKYIENGKMVFKSL